MSATVSPATGKQYGISRTCTVLAWPRSSFYFQRSPRPKPAGKPGPKPKWSDAAEARRYGTHYPPFLKGGRGD
jgi:hypothetical protein